MRGGAFVGKPQEREREREIAVGVARRTKRKRELFRERGYPGWGRPQSRADPRRRMQAYGGFFFPL